MTTDVLIAYASKHGSTEQVARRVAEVLRAHGLATTVKQAGEVTDLDGARAVVLGGSIYMGRWHRDARGFLTHHADALDDIPFAVFALGPGKNTEHDFEQSRKQLDHALAKEPELEPRAVTVFGGVVRPDQLRFPFNHMPAVDIRDWPTIHAWAAELPALLGLDREVVSA
jgi:menaquinone-dependent protoporphyrinogen oxidase